jgi:colanic acid biosynthesis glycosyl transferase WcaI
LLQAALAMRAETNVAFVFIGGGSEFQKLVEFAGRHALRNILYLPYQSLVTLSDSLSAADLHLVVMGDPFVGIVHPCKIYNVLAVGSPCLYIGPLPSHVTELAAHVPSDSVSCAAHGDVTAVVDRIRRSAGLGLRRSVANAGLAEQFAPSWLVPQMISIVEDAGHLAEELIPQAVLP